MPMYKQNIHVISTQFLFIGNQRKHWARTQLLSIWPFLLWECSNILWNSMKRSFDTWGNIARKKVFSSFSISNWDTFSGKSNGIEDLKLGPSRIKQDAHQPWLHPMHCWSLCWHLGSNYQCTFFFLNTDFLNNRTQNLWSFWDLLPHSTHI